MEDAELVFLPDPAEPWKRMPDPDEEAVYLLVCPECLATQEGTK